MKAKLKLVVVMLLALTALQCHAASDGLGYSIISEADRTAAVGGLTNISGAIEIPQKVIINSKTYTVTAVSDRGFKNRHGLTSVTIPNSVTSIGESAFFGCSGLTSVTIGNSVETIGDDAFWNCSGLSSVTIPNSVKTIGWNAFAHCSGLTSVTIGNSVETIGEFAFSCDNLTDINVNSENTHYSSINGVLYDKNASTLILCPRQKTSLTIPNSVETIRKRAFNRCSELSSVTIGNSVETIGDYAFSDCSELTSVTIPNSVKTIGLDAFKRCSKLTSVTIGNSVETIGADAFYDCSGLTSITIPNSVTSIGVSVFAHCSGLTSVTIPNSVTSIGNGAFQYCSGLTSVTIPNSVKTIGLMAFYDCSGLTSVTIGNSVETIEDYAFDGCPKLEAIYMQCEVPIAFTAKFSDDNLKNTILYIPKGTLAAYEKTTPWRDFWNIVEMDFSGVDEVAEDGGDAVRVENGRIVTEGDALTEVLDLQGRTVYRGYDRVIDNLPRGLYVVRSGNNTVKIKL